MNDESLSNLLHEADVTPRALRSDLPARVLRRRRNRRVVRACASSTAMLMIAFAGCWIIWQRNPRTLDVATTQAQPATGARSMPFDAQLAVYEQTAERLVSAQESRTRRERASDRAPAPDALVAMQSQREQAAMTLVQQAQRCSSDPARADAAAAKFRLAVELFPDTPAARVAQRRLDALESPLRS